MIDMLFGIATFSVPCPKHLRVLHSIIQNADSVSGYGTSLPLLLAHNFGED